MTRNIRTTLLTLTAVATSTVVMVGTASAEVSAEEAKQLGTTLTVWGAEKAGNKEGTIPAYTGEKIAPPAGWDRKKQGFPDPWGEKPLFTITAQNVAKYADKLDGMVEVFKKYPNFRMDIYPTHRIFAMPKYVVDNSIKNATGCKTSQDQYSLDGCYPGVLFPIPKTGNQVMWNKLLNYGSNAWVSENVSTYVTPVSGSPVLQSANLITTELPLYNPANTKVIGHDDVYFRARVDQTGPARGNGNKYVFLYSVNTIDVGSRAWSYIPGQRRVKLSPDLAYDTPSPISGGASLMDEQTGFLGAMDRFDFKLAGKKEKYIMANNFNLTDPRVCPDSKVTGTKNFPNPDCVRWELHRVWVVEAKLKPQYRHVYKTRKFFFDEDGFIPGGQEGYDGAGTLYRITNSSSYSFFNGGGTSSQGMVEMDLLTGIWTLQGAYGSEGGAYYVIPPVNDHFFTPDSLAAEGIR